MTSRCPAPLREDAGLASGLVNTTAQVGGALGLAVLATLSTTRSNNLIAEGQSKAAALTSGYHLAFLIGAILLAAAFVVGITVLQPTESAAPLPANRARSKGPRASPPTPRAPSSSRLS